MVSGGTSTSDPEEAQEVLSRELVDLRIESVVRFWQHVSATQFSERLRGSTADPRARLNALTMGLIEEDLARYDVPVRTWATQEHGVATLVRQVDKERLDLVREIFAALGFRGVDLETRARTFVTHFSLEHFMHVRRSKHDRLAEAQGLIELLMQPPLARAQRRRKGRGADAAMSVNGNAGDWRNLAGRFRRALRRRVNGMCWGLRMR